MATLTLQRAAQIFNRIKTETAFAAEPEEDAYAGYGRRRAPKPKNTFTLNVTLSVDGPVRQQAEAYRNLLIGKKSRMFGLMEIGTKIRVATAAKQATCGVTQLVTQRVMVTQKIKILEHLLETLETNTFSPDLLDQQAEVIKQRLSMSTQGATVAQVATAVLTAQDRDDFARELNVQRSLLMSIDDQLAGLNATNNITISEDDLELLQDAGLAA